MTSYSDGAMRAASRILGNIGVTAWPTASVTAAARIISEETGDVELRKALEAAQALIDALMPGIKHIAVQDYAAVNETPIRIRAALSRAKGDSHE